uniref:ORF1 n=1 Tax=Grey teal picobirnavirus Z TaxID=2592490 RepID=A0A5B8JT18_9VIRU|nr:ORF1 [Grey teal picobirnavirus Z]
MTSNLVAYWRFGEDRRHNYENELLAEQQLEEATRHNRAMEALQQQQIALGFANLAEQARHNKISEGTSFYLGKRQQDEAYRHNFAMETLQGAAQSETQRHNITMETMTDEMNQHKKWYDQGTLGISKEHLTLDFITGGANIVFGTSREARQWFEAVPKAASSIIDSIIPF